MAGKNAAGVVKSLDDKLISVGVILEKVKAQCKGCPNVSVLSVFKPNVRSFVFVFILILCCIGVLIVNGHMESSEIPAGARLAV